jgi:hypothetical protein
VADISEAVRNQLLNIAKQQGVRLAGELPPPFGAAATRIADMLGLAAAPTLTADQVQQMINAAVATIENFITSLSVSEKEYNATAVLTWIQAAIAYYETEPGDSTDDLEKRLDFLESRVEPETGSLTNDLGQVTKDDSVVGTGTVLFRKDDRAMSFVLTNLSAQMLVNKTMAMLAARRAELFRSAGLNHANEQQYNDSHVFRPTQSSPACTNRSSAPPPSPSPPTWPRSTPPRCTAP